MLEADFELGIVPQAGTLQAGFGLGDAPTGSREGGVVGPHALRDGIEAHDEAGQFALGSKAGLQGKGQQE
ncbi:hypothetical protein GCM10007100_16820 [Roseibacillus persicicus]|uniref:Uncharacterized protein n=1 Tax=Roseibacillus persicicus TaxID=454148 RepID=A0A918TJX2_9BACT|nr:hypothetical protein GCM10007100_16820 [Roseibacillus persicicus]